MFPATLLKKNKENAKKIALFLRYTICAVKLDTNVVLHDDSFMFSLLLYLSLLTQFLTSIQFDKF